MLTSQAIVLLIAILVTLGSAYVAGRMAEARSRSVRTWQWVAALIGPLALPLLLALPARSSR